MALPLIDQATSEIGRALQAVVLGWSRSAKLSNTACSRPLRDRVRRGWCLGGQCVDVVLSACFDQFRNDTSDSGEMVHSQSDL
jgi:hypothetical protein